MRSYNRHYGYDDMFLWNEESWKDRVCIMDPIVLEAVRISKRNAEEAPPAPHYADRHDEEKDTTNFCAFFQDVVDDWREKGLCFYCTGMMGLSMVPISVVERRKRDPKILIVPKFADLHKTPHTAMEILYEYRELLEVCAEKEILVQFLTMRGMEGTGILQERGLETQGFFRITYDPVYLDITELVNAGVALSEIEGVDAADYRDILDLGPAKIVDVSDKWQPRTAHQVSISQGYRKMLKDWDYEKHIHSGVGRAQAKSMRLEYDFERADDPRLIELWRKKGLRYEEHQTDHELWFALIPECVFEEPEKKIPVLCVLKEPRTAIPFMSLTAMQFYCSFAEIAATGEFMMIFFAMETPEDNELWLDVLSDADALYPIDRSRIYMTGQSHNGYYTLEFYRRHPEVIAAAATLCDPIGMQVGGQVGNYDTEAERIDRSFAEYDRPLINLSGQLENKCFTAEVGSELERQQAEYYRRRLKAFRCPERSIDEILAAKHSDDYTTRMNGIPADRTETRFIMGNECYVSDVKNMDGKWHLRFVTLENLPHMMAPQMGELAWEFMRRFARDTQTLETIELY